MISDLPIWSAEPVDLNWYRAVADNQLPAKYILARRIAIPADFASYDTDQLWQLHQDASDQLIQLQSDIRTTQVNIASLEKQTTSLLDLNVELVNRMLTSCNFCQWRCEVDRSDESAKPGACQLGEETRVGSYFHHRGEELLYRGRMGSGTIFFTSCNMRCQFCQNGNISQDKYNGKRTTAKELAAMIWLLRIEGCHNINFVGGDPTIHLHTIINAIAQLGERPSLDTLREIEKVKSDRFIQYRRDDKYGNYHGEFNVPLLWNANFFMSTETMRILRTVIDIWLPDFKFGTDKKCAIRLSRTPWYWDTITRNLQLIHDWGEDFTIRHLIMPNHINCCSRPIIEWIATHLPGIQVNLMDQYHPDSFTNPQTNKYNERYADIARQITSEEFSEVLYLAEQYHLNYETITFS